MTIHCSISLTRRVPRLLSDLSTEKVAALIGYSNESDFFVEDIIPAVNESFDCRDHFFVSNRQIQQLNDKARRRGGVVLGILHTHPEHLPAGPSQADISGSQYSVNAVFHPSSGLLTFFDASGVVFSRSISLQPFFAPAPALLGT